MERLDKFLCDSGAGTRSQVKVILKAGRVTVDGKVEKDNSRKIDPANQVVTLDGEILGGKRFHIHLTGGAFMPGIIDLGHFLFGRNQPVQ